MSSLRRIEASRANGARSHGPSTPEGKARSATNATRHGLLARAVVLQAENEQAFQALHQDYVEQFRPAGSVEWCLVEEMAVATWRTRRCWAMETRTVDIASSRAGAPSVSSIAAAYSELAEGPGLTLIHRYEARSNQNFQRALRNLILLRQNTELPKEPNPISEQAIPGGRLETAELPNER